MHSQSVNTGYSEALQAYSKESITKAYKQGDLGFRAVSLAKERKYIGNPYKYPRPVYLVFEDAPIKMRLITPSTIAIINPDILAAYKANASTEYLTSSEKQPDELDVKCMSDLCSLKTKMSEQAERGNWGLYPPATSGHLAKGHFTLPKPKSNGSDHRMEHSELLTTGYQKEQIACYCVDRETGESVTQILQKKRELEKSLGIAKLLIGVYSQHSGSLQLWSEQELILPDANPSAGEALLARYACALGTPEKNLRQTINMLPLPQKISFLDDLGKRFVPPAKEVPTAGELIELVSNPQKESAETLREYFKRGAHIDNPVAYEDGFYTLMYVFLKSNWGKDDPDGTLAANMEALFTELVRCGTDIRYSELDYLLQYGHPCVTQFTERIAALSRTTEGTFRCYNYSNCLLYKDCDATTVIFDRIFSIGDFSFLQDHLFWLVTVPFSMGRFTENHRQQLMMLFYYGADPRPLKQKILVTFERMQESGSNRFKYVRGQGNPLKWPDELISLWENRESNLDFINWPAKVAEATARIEPLKNGYEPYPIPDRTTEETAPQEYLQPLVNAFQQPLVLERAGDNNENIVQILQHYYRRPGPERVQNLLWRSTLPTAWKQNNSCSHVLRVRNNVHWYMALLKKFGLAQFSDDEKTLLALAAIYHDAAAEDVGKHEEESRAALYFKRDLARHFDSDLLEEIGKALESKEDDIKECDETTLNERLRSYIRVLRFGDRMDYIRCSTITPGFPDWHQRQDSGHFDTKLLDLPPQAKENFSSNPAKKTDFQRELEACMHGAVDLASVTGANLRGSTEKGPYHEQHQLTYDSASLKRSFEQTPVPLERIDRMIDDNVRRVIAREAGLKTCNSEDHRQCRADTREGIYHGIHNSWHDLKQVRIPVSMSLVEKMQCGHDLSLLTPETRRQIQNEVTRLKEEGIAMNLGTLTQDTLASDEVQQMLEKRGITVVSELRRRGWDLSGDPVYQQMLVPVQKRSGRTDVS